MNLQSQSAFPQHPCWHHVLGLPVCLYLWCTVTILITAATCHLLSANHNFDPGKTQQATVKQAKMVKHKEPTRNVQIGETCLSIALCCKPVLSHTLNPRPITITNLATKISCSRPIRTSQHKDMININKLNVRCLPIIFSSAIGTFAHWMSALVHGWNWPWINLWVLQGFITSMDPHMPTALTLAGITQEAAFSSCHSALSAGLWHHCCRINATLLCDVMKMDTARGEPSYIEWTSSSWPGGAGGVLEGWCLIYEIPAQSIGTRTKRVAYCCRDDVDGDVAPRS